MLKSCRGRDARKLIRASALAAALSLPAQVMAQDDQPGEAVWQEACARCHDDVASLVRDLPLPDDTAGWTELDRFLSRHHARDREERAELIEWLLVQVSE